MIPAKKKHNSSLLKLEQTLLPDSSLAHLKPMVAQAGESATAAGTEGGLEIPSALS
jgi:hypothetical protein